jgi:hypothetical protein
MNVMKTALVLMIAVSCTQVDPTETVRRQTMTCWFKRQKPFSP